MNLCERVMKNPRNSPRLVKEEKEKKIVQGLKLWHQKLLLSSRESQFLSEARKCDEKPGQSQRLLR